MKGVSLCESSHIASALSLVTMQQPWSRSMGIIGVLAKPAAINLCIALVKPCQSVWALTKKKTIELMYSLMKIDLVGLIIF